MKRCLVRVRVTYDSRFCFLEAADTSRIVFDLATNMRRGYTEVCLKVGHPNFQRLQGGDR